jgi:LuxR family maltose regulon positive regulatory protein
VESLVDDAMMYRFVSLRAPAGYGKTTTLSGCYTLLNKAEGISAWLNLTDFDGSLGEFAGYLSQAFSWSGSNKSVQSAQWENGWFEAPSFQSLSREFCNAASRFEDPAYLFLDDFDAIIDTDAERFIYQVLRDAPPNLHIIISCRSAPSFGVGRLRMQGQFAEVGVEQLRFSEADAASLLGAASTVEVEDRLISLAVKKTEGWPAGLQLVAIALAHSDSVEKLLNSFNGEIQEVGEFLAEDVLEKLDPRLTEFLIHTSILKRFSVSLANAITGRNDSREIIDELERNSLFIFSLDSEKKWYRYQSLFAGFLLRTLNDRYSNRVSALYLKASDWCVAESLIVQGAKYALNAENFSRTAEILDTHAEVLLSRGLFDTLYSLVACLPTDVLQAHPRLRLWEASYLICHRQFREAQPILMQVEEYLNELSSCNELSEENIRSLRSTLLHGKLMLAQFMDDMPSLERLCLEVLSDSVEYDGVLTGILQTSLLHAQREQYRLDEVELRSALGHESFARVDQPMLSIGLESVLGPTYAQRGEFDSAAACYWRALAACDDSVTDDALIQSGLFVLQADLFLERFEIDKARELFESDYGAINGIGINNGIKII